MPVKLDLACLNVSSSHGGMKSSGVVKFLDTSMPSFDGKRVIVESCVLLAKDKRHDVDYKPDHIGFTVGDELVIGYGLDCKEKYRNLSYIGVLSAEAI